MLYYCPDCGYINYVKHWTKTKDLMLSPITWTVRQEDNWQKGNYCQNCGYEVSEVSEDDIDDYIHQEVEELLEDIYKHFDEMIPKRYIQNTIYEWYTPLGKGDKKNVK